MARKLVEKLDCYACIECLLDKKHERTDENTSLISIKNRGGLMSPSVEVRVICNSSEKLFRQKMRMNSNFYLQTDAVNRFIAKVVEVCLLKDLFSDNEHLFNPEEPDKSHFVFLIQSIIKWYFKIRIFHYIKSKNAELNLNTLRQHFNKLILFRGM